MDYSSRTTTTDETFLKQTNKQPRYKATEAVKYLRLVTGKQHEDKTTRGLTNCILAYIHHLNGFVSEVDNRGIYNKELQKFVPSRIVNGFPDIVACINGRFVGIEIKAGKDRQRQAQYETQIAITEAKGIYFLCRNFQSFFDYVEARRAKK